MTPDDASGIDRALDDIRKRKRARQRIERRTPDCLSFTELERVARRDAGVGAAAHRHLEGCDRCASLAMRLRTHVAALADAAPSGRRSRVIPALSRRRTPALLAIATLAAAAVVIIAIVPEERGTGPGQLAGRVAMRGLAGVYEEGVPGGLLEDLLTRSYDEAAPSLGGVDELAAGVRRYRVGVRGPRFFGYCNPDPGRGLPCEALDCAGGKAPAGSPCEDPATPATCRESRLTLEIHLPAAFDATRDTPGETPLVAVIHANDPEASVDVTCGGDRALAEALAREGTPAVLWFERDTVPLPGHEPVPPLCRQFGFDTDADLRLAGYRWMMLSDPMTLDAGDLRMDVRFAHAQSFVLATSFFHAFVRERIASRSADVDPWLAKLRSVLVADVADRCGDGFGGESGVDAGCVSAAGIDQRAVAILVGGGGFSDGGEDAYRRYESDWRLCAAESLDCGVRTDPSSVDPWKDFASWAWRHRDDGVSYFDTYLPTRDPARYQDLVVLDVASTHAWAAPLGALIEGSAAPQRPPRDGLYESRGTGPHFDIHRLRRVNRDRGVPAVVAYVGEVPLTDSALLVRRAVASLHGGHLLPTVELESFDTRDPHRWRGVLRVRGQSGPQSVPDVETLTVSVAMSDDRDFRRCSAPILCADGAWCAEVASCLEPERDDNKDAEDRFFSVNVDAADVQSSGDLRMFEIDPPIERGDFASLPLLAIVVEVRFAGEDPSESHVLDDLLLDSEVVFVNEHLYPAYECPD